MGKVQYSPLTDPCRFRIKPTGQFSVSLLGMVEIPVGGDIRPEPGDFLLSTQDLSVVGVMTDTDTGFVFPKGFDERAGRFVSFKTLSPAGLQELFRR